MRWRGLPPEPPPLLTSRKSATRLDVFGVGVPLTAFLAAAIAATLLAATADHALVLAAGGKPRSMRPLVAALALPGDAFALAGALAAAALFAWTRRRRAREPGARAAADSLLRAVLFVAFAVALAAALEETTHLLLSRQRPSVYLATGVDEWRPLGMKITGKWGSFPSGHTARAFAAAAAAWMAWGQGRAWLLALAIAALVGRFGMVSHFPSDLVAGAALGILAANLARALSDRFAGGTG